MKRIIYTYLRVFNALIIVEMVLSVLFSSLTKMVS
jgi:hypothetical protein